MHPFHLAPLDKRNISEDTTTTTTSEDLEDNCEGKYFSSRHGVRKTIANPGRGIYQTLTSTTHQSDIAPSGTGSGNGTSSNKHGKHHHHHHHHHHLYPWI